MAKETPQSRYRLKHPEMYREASQRYRERVGKEEARRQYRKAYSNLRTKVFDLLGHECVRCGFSDKRALQVDHIHGGGSKEHRKIRNSGVYRRALKEPEDFQILCANCNQIKKIENHELRTLEDF